MQINKKIVLILVVLILAVTGGIFAYSKFQSKPKETVQEESKKKKITEPVNVIPVAERPVVYIWPVDSRNLSIEVATVVKEAQEVEYELEYQAGSLLQGAFGSIALDSVPAATKILLGSCSAGGACTYHTDVKGGTLLTRFSGPENYALKADWKYFADKETALSSKDGKFQIEAKSLGQQPYVIIFNGYGYPKGVKGTVISEPYTLTTANTLSGTADLTIRASEEGAATIQGWDGQKWHEFETKVDGKMATAQVDLMQLYVVVK